MDKVKIVLDIVKKHHFWMLAALVVVVGISVYVVAASDLKGQYAKRVETLKSAADATEAVANDPDHPNEKRIENWKVEKEQQEKKVGEAWQKLYDQQRVANPWPDKLGPRFLKKIEELGPHKEIPSYPYGEIYSDAIGKAAPQLLLTVDYQRMVPIEPEKKDASKKGAATPPRPTGRLDGPGGFGQENMKPIGTVDWKTASLVQQEFELLPARPSSLQVRLTQENYWVYKALLTIVSKTNGDAKTHADAAIKEIVNLQIGKPASAYITTNQPGILAAGDAGAATGGMTGGPPMAEAGYGPTAGGAGPSMMDLSGGAGPSATQAAAPEDALLGYRYVEYVDGEIKPLPAESVKSGLPYPEFKMMPVVMVLVIDQRKIPDLLVQCANSTMAVEPVQVRINPGKGSVGGYGPGGGGGGGMSLGMEGGMGPQGVGMGPAMEPGGPMPGMGMAPTGPGPGGMGGMGPSIGGMGMMGGMGMLGAGDEEASPYEVTVELRAIIFIYNPPPEPTSEAAAATPSA